MSETNKPERRQTAAASNACHAAARDTDKQKRDSSKQQRLASL